MLTLWNVYSFFITYAEIDGFDPSAPSPAALDRPVLDRWCLARLAETIDAVRASMDRYEAQPATRAVELRAPCRSAARHCLAGAAPGRRPIFVR